MSDRLDRLEKLVESNSKAIESWANESIQYRRDAEERDRQMAASIEQIKQTTERLTSVSELLVYIDWNRQFARFGGVGEG